VLSSDPNEPGLIRWLRNPDVRRSLTLTSLWVFIAVVLFRFRQALLPFALALLIAFILEPLVDWLSQQKVSGRPVPRILAIIGIYVVFIALSATFGTWAVSQIGHELAGVGKVTKSLLVEARAMTRDLLDAAETFAVENSLPVDRKEIQAVVEQNLVSTTEEASRYAASLFTLGRDVVGGTFRAVFGLFLVLMLTAFMSMDRARIEAFFHSLKPVPGPALVDGKLSAAGQRGKEVFDLALCSACHSGPYLTDGKRHMVNTGLRRESGKAWDTPGLREIWRTAPYLHDGRAATLEDVIGSANPGDKHGRTSSLNSQQREDLIEYLRSL